jgi:voltage-gated potassium channel
VAAGVPNGATMSMRPSVNWFFRFVLRKPLTPGRAGRAIALATLIITLIGGMLMRIVDADEFDNIWLGLWWAVQTMTTVGYGDIVPTHPGGQVVAAVLMLSGIGFLTVVTAAITAALLESVRGQFGEPTQERLEAKLDEVSTRLERLEAALGRDR